MKLTIASDPLTFIQINGPIAKHLDDKEALRRLIATKLASHPPEDAKVVWARLAAATSHLPEFLDELEEVLLPYESVPWDENGGSTRSLQLMVSVRNIVGMLSSSTVLCCKSHLSATQPPRN